MSCRLDYCNSLLSGVAEVHLQSVRNAAARLVSDARLYDHITLSVLVTLHRLPIRQRVVFKTTVLVHDKAPRYTAHLRVPAVVVSHVLWCLRSFQCPGLGLPGASAALLCMALEHGTDYEQHFDRQNLHCPRSSVTSRPVCSSIKSMLVAAVSCAIVRRRLENVECEQNRTDSFIDE